MIYRLVDTNVEEVTPCVKKILTNGAER